MIERTAKLFWEQLLKMCTKHSTSYLLATVALVITALICQLLPLLPKKSLICSLYCTGRNFIAKSIMTRHEFSSSFWRTFCVAICCAHSHCTQTSTYPSPLPSRSLCLASLPPLAVLLLDSHSARIRSSVGDHIHH